MERISWDEYFMRLAEITSMRSTCVRRKVGAVIVRDNQILSTGYNGSPKGVINCSEDESRCIRQALNIKSGEMLDKCYSVHAEQNAIIQCAINGNNTQGATLYVTTSPCITCLKMILNAGIQKIVVKEIYPDEISKQLMKETNIEVLVLK